MDNVKPTVFIVDDDEAVCKSLGMLIEGEGLAVQTYENAADFLNAYDPALAGCLVVDVRMPGMSGLELQEELAKRGHNIPTIIITGHADLPMAVEAVKTGAVSFIEKPFTDETLLADIRKALALDAKARGIRPD